MLTDRNVHVKPTPPTLGSAGTSYQDPVFGSWVTRATDANTRASAIGASYTTPGAGPQHGWNSNSTRFYVRSNGGSWHIIGWNNATRTPTYQQSVPLVFDACFSTTNPDYIYGCGSAYSNAHTVVRADLATTPATITVVADCDVLIPSLPGLGATYMNAVVIGNGNLAFTCGGASQDYMFYVIWYPLASPGSAKILNTLTAIGYHNHSCQIDQSGRYVLITASSWENPIHSLWVWDTTTDAITPITVASGGHSSMGWGYMINADSISTWDSAQWLVRSMATPDTGVRQCITPVRSPSELFMGEHSTWNNSTNGTFQPHVSATYRYYDGPNNVNPKNTSPWKEWDDEVIAVQNDGVTTQVNRLCHHRTLVWPDVGTGAFEFDYTPRPNISPDGTAVIFTSNMDKTLGIDPNDGLARRDVFVVENLTTPTVPTPPTPATVHQRHGRWHR